MTVDAVNQVFSSNFHQVEFRRLLWDGCKFYYDELEKITMPLYQAETDILDPDSEEYENFWTDRFDDVMHFLL